MRRIRLLVVLFGAICLDSFVFSFPSQARDPAPFIVDGVDAPDYFGSFVVRIVTDDRRLCSGTFIGNSWVLTAAHCIADRAEVFSGSTRVSRLSSKGGATGFSHPSYDSEADVPHYDFGLYRLDTPADLSGVLLPSLTNYDDSWAWTAGLNAVTVGWGLTSANGSLSPVLQETTLQIQDDATCADLDRSLGVVFDPTSTLCANDTSSSACNGDSGGPLLVQSSTGDFEVLGVTSYGPEDCDGHSVYGWVPAVLSWVRTTTGLPVGSGTPASAPRPATRIFGLDRFQTAAAVGAFWDDSNAIFVATGAKFPDALAAGVAAGTLDAPVLLVNPSSVPISTRYQIARLSPSTIYVAGGPDAIGDAVVAELGAIVGSNVVRLGGADRYETSDLFGTLIDEGNVGERVWLASGRDFADPLVASTAASVFGEPFVLIEGTQSLPERTRQRLAALQPTKIVVVGPDSSFGPAVRASLSSIAVVQYLTGGDAAWRSAVIWGDLVESETVSLATVENFPDALAAVPYSSHGSTTPLMLVPRNCVPTPVADQVNRLGADRITLLGGPMALGESVENFQPC